MPPATLRAFGFDVVPEDDPVDGEVDGDDKVLPPKQPFGKDPRVYCGLGSDMGHVELEDGTKVDAGRLLMRDQWNSALYPSLEEVREKDDVWLHKDRMSALWNSSTLCTKYLESAGIKTLLFAGVNTDQCVGGSIQDAFSKGYDCLMLTDGCGTTSPNAAQECIEYNSMKSWGFALTCKDLADGVEKMQHA